MSKISITKEALENLMKANEYSYCVVGTIYDETKAQKTAVHYGSKKGGCRYTGTTVAVSFDPYDADEDYYGWYNNDGSPISPDDARAMAQREYKLNLIPQYEFTSKLRVRTPDMYGDSESFSTVEELMVALHTLDFVTLQNPPEVTNNI